jgi:hypothetical protein
MKKLLAALFLSICLTFGSASAMTCMEPAPVDGYEYLVIRYDPMGNAIVLVDGDGDGKCDFGQIFNLVKNTQTGEIFYMPYGKPMSCNIAYKGMERGAELFKKMGVEPKCFDTDTNQIRDEKDRWADNETDSGA